MTADVEVRDGVAHVRLTRDAIDLATARGLLDAAHRTRSEDVRAVLLTSAGRSFCLGGDLKEFAAVSDLRGHLLQVTSALHEALRIFATLDAPLVAAVHGAVAGAGLGLVAAADLAIAADDATFVAAYTGIGYTPDAGVSWSLPRLIGPRRALDLLLTNRTMDATEALDAGLLTAVVPPQQVIPAATELAAQLAAGPTQAFAVTKRLVRQGLQVPFSAHLDDESRAIADAGVSAHGCEGVAAFLSKRRPRYTS
ncbi:enoyl-CoA hydratase/isomerase family protein [Lentzea sp. NPDC051838]|uniref:enoyl-CoA hydratase/isomerase family protein n=1 Tax=Lentzea sp. NPDC051838 TaxID=3154849 RepID=UPI003420E7BD